MPNRVGLFITELSYQQGGWDKARGRKLRTLFDHWPGYDEKVYRYKYQTMITNQTLPAIEVWEQYKSRADAENRIKELRRFWNSKILYEYLLGNGNSYENDDYSL